MSRKTSSNKNNNNSQELSEFLPGELVWVRTGLGSYAEDPATVVQLRDDGILVRFQSSSLESLVEFDRVRLLEARNDPEDSGRRRSKRIRSSIQDNKKQDAINENQISHVQKAHMDDNQKDQECDNNNNNNKTPSISPNDETVLMEKKKITKKQRSKTNDQLKKKSKTTKLGEKTSSRGKRKIPSLSDADTEDDISEDFMKKPDYKRNGADTNNKRASGNKSKNKFENIRKEKGNIDESTNDLTDRKTESPYFAKKKKVKRSVKETGNAKKIKAKRSIILSVDSAKSNEGDDDTSAQDQEATSKHQQCRPVLAGQPDGHGGLTVPFFVEYSKSSRATCRRCHGVIVKGDVRIGYAPLFRGKPGFTIYKHLDCNVFSDEIYCAEDVIGYENLNEEDYRALAARVHESRKELKEEMEELQPDELVTKAFQGEIRSSPKGLVANLLPFQVEGTSWMYHQEVKVPDIRGGILADEMGMGKTLQTIVVMLDNRPNLQHSLPGTKYPPLSNKESLKKEDKLWDRALTDWHHEMKMNDVPDFILSEPKNRKKKIKGVELEGGARAGTLIVCPVIALSQWEAEIIKFTESGTFSVCIYHGSKRSSEMPRELLCKYDVVITTYQVLEADFRKMISPNRVPCPNCGKRFKIDKLKFHLKYYCGEDAQRTEAQSRQQRNSDRNQDVQTGSHRSRNRNRKHDSRNSKTSFDKKEKPSKIKTPPKSSRSNLRQKKKGRKKIESDSDFSFSDETNDESLSLDISASSKFRSSINKKKESKKRPEKSQRVCIESDVPFSDHSSNSDDSLIGRAKAKQYKAFEQAKKSHISKNKNNRKKKKYMSKKMKANKKNENLASSDDSDYDSESKSDVNGEVDSGVDFNLLREKSLKGSKMSALHSLCWWRIVLDEAHYIKSRSSQTTKAASALIGIHRWALSGTPLQNRVGEFYSLVRFLRIIPMAQYMCKKKGCDCKSLHYRMLGGVCQDCNHGSVLHYSYFNKFVLNPIQNYGYSGDGRRAMFILKNEVMDKCLLRRTKETKAEDMNLPPRIVTIKTVRLHPIEEDFYNSLYTKTKASFNDYVEAGTLLNNYAHVFDLLMRMRQSVDHPYLVLHSKTNSGGIGNKQNIANGTIDCDICHERAIDRVISSCCQQGFCRTCVIEYMETSAGISSSRNSIPCPSCRSPFTIDLNQSQMAGINSDGISQVVSTNAEFAVSNSLGMPSLKELPHVSTGSILRRINLAEFATSTKIEALTQELVSMRTRSPGSKAIVFSQFVNMLDLIRWRLHSDPCLADLGIGVRAIHGGMDVKARNSSLHDFRENSNVRVLLMSLKAGGVALNLTVANHIYLMDPWWNPAAEMQAIDRTHRLGQKRPIRAVRFIAEDTVEEKILQLQEKKRLVFDGTVGRDACSLQMLTATDMKSLFS